MAEEEFRKDDSGKTMMGCLPPKALLAIGRVLTFGAKKYGRDNWHKVAGSERYYDALLRHLNAWWGGEDLDPDTKESHLAHAGCCLLFLLELRERGKLKEDRPFSGGPTPSMVMVGGQLSDGVTAVASGALGPVPE